MGRIVGILWREAPLYHYTPIAVIDFLFFEAGGILPGSSSLAEVFNAPSSDPYHFQTRVLSPTESREAALEAMPAVRRWRSLSAVIASSTVGGLTFGMSMPLLSLLLERDGVASTWIGVNAAAASLAVVIVGPFVPRVVDAFGVLRSMIVSIALCVAIFLLLPLWTGAGPWFVLRFLLGCFAAITWIVGETWVITMTTKANRGKIIAVYILMWTIGAACGPLLINLVGIEGWAPFVVAASILALSAAPLAFARGAAPRLPPRLPAAFATAFGAAPLVLAAAALSGINFAALMSLLPIYGLGKALDQDSAILLLTMFIVGNVVLQLPIGWLADHTDTRRLLIVFTVISLVAPLLLPMYLSNGVVLWTLLILWGGACAGIYTLGMVMLGEHFAPAALAGATAAFVAVFEAGSVLGPILGGGAMDVLGADGLMALMAAAAGVFLLLAAVRTVVYKRTP